jgi:1-deoxy-D-xylulose 5-phosphate reductoisomerase
MTASTWSSIRRRPSTRSCASATAAPSRTSEIRTCACPSLTRSPTPSGRRRPCRPWASPGRGSFEEPDLETFPLLRLGRSAGERGGTFPCAYNAANEVAVDAFLAGRLPFLGIAAVVEETLARWDGDSVRDVQDLLEADARARDLASQELVVG